MALIDGYDPTALTLFISYAWDKKAGRADEVRALAKHLRNKKKLNVWIDESEMFGSTEERMAEGIDEADVVLLFFSEAYQDSRNCNKEATYADQQKKPILPIRMQKDFPLKGWLGFIIGDGLWIDFKVGAAIEDIAEQLTGKLYPLFDQSNLEKEQKIGKFKTIGINSQLYAKGCYRDLDYQSKLDAIKKVAKDGLLVLAGEKGVGKTYFISLLLRQPENRRFLMNECNIGTVLWLNCCPWHDERRFDEAEKRKFQAELLKLIASATKRRTKISFDKHVEILNERLRAPPLFIFDDVFHYPLLAFIREQCKGLPCIAIMNTDCAEEMQRRTRPSSDTSSSSVTLWDEVVNVYETVQRLPDDAIRKMLRDTFGLKLNDDELRRMAAACNGLPREAAIAAGRTTGKANETVNFVAGVAKSNTDWAVNKAKAIEDPSVQQEVSKEAPLDEIKFIEVPKFDNYFVRQEEEDGLRKGMRCLCRANGDSNGFFVIEGCGGIGKSTLVAHVLRDPKHSAYFQRECDIQIVIWLNCYQWHDGFDGCKADERKFLDELLALGAKADGSVREDSKTLDQMWQHFAKRKQRVLFVLDDVFHYTILDTFRTECSNFPCCAVTRDAMGLKKPAFDPFMKMQDQVANPYLVGYLTSARILEVFQEDFRLKDKLSNEQLEERAKRSCGMPLLVNLIGGQLVDSKNYERAYKKLIEQCKMGSLDVGKTGRGEKTASQLFDSAWKSLSIENRHSYYSFLLYNPVEEIPETTLQSLWNCESREDVQDICRQWERLSLVRTIVYENSFGIVFGRNYLVHQILHESVAKIAGDEFEIQQKKNDKSSKMFMSQLRIRILRHDYEEEEEGSISHMLECMDRLRLWPLSRVLQHIDGEAFRFLEDENAQDYSGLVPKEAQITAARRGHYYLFKFLLDIGCDADASDADGKTAVMRAAEEGHDKIVDFLITKMPQGERSGRKLVEALTMAAHNFQEKTVDLILSKGVPIDGLGQHGDTPLTYVIARNFKAVEMFLARGANVDAVDIRGQTPLMCAAEWGCTEMVKRLLSKGAQVNLVNREGQTALMLGASQAREEIDELLVEHGAQIELCNNKGGNALHKAASAYGKGKGSPKTVEYLLSKGMNIESRDKDGSTPLMEASLSGRYDTVEFLIAKGAQIDARNSYGNTALFLAAHYDQVAVCELLVSKGADVNVVGNFGHTPLIRAAKNNHEKTVELLLSKGANIEARDNEGQTALMLAIANDSLKAAEVLLSKGASLDARDNNGQTALMKARSRDSQGQWAAEFLLSHGAEE